MGSLQDVRIQCLREFVYFRHHMQANTQARLDEEPILRIVQPPSGLFEVAIPFRRGRETDRRQEMRATVSPVQIKQGIYWAGVRLQNYNTLITRKSQRHEPQPFYTNENFHRGIAIAMVPYYGIPLSNPPIMINAEFQLGISHGHRTNKLPCFVTERSITIYIEDYQIDTNLRAIIEGLAQVSQPLSTQVDDSDDHDSSDDRDSSDDAPSDASPILTHR